MDGLTMRIPALALLLCALSHSGLLAAQVPDGLADSARASPREKSVESASPRGEAPRSAGPALGRDAPDTLTGEVVDIQCALRMRAAVPGNGAKSGWNVCGTDAVRRGAPVGLRERDSDSLYLVVLQARRSAGRMLSPHVGRQVMAVGFRRSDGDLRLFEITKFLGPAPAEARGTAVKP